MLLYVGTYGMHMPFGIGECRPTFVGVVVRTGQDNIVCLFLLLLLLSSNQNSHNTPSLSLVFRLTLPDGQPWPASPIDVDLEYFCSS